MAPLSSLRGFRAVVFLLGFPRAKRHLGFQSWGGFACASCSHLLEDSFLAVTLSSHALDQQGSVLRGSELLGHSFESPRLPWFCLIFVFIFLECSHSSFLQKDLIIDKLSESESDTVLMLFWGTWIDV